MGNRVIEQKKQKIKRMRRAYLKKFSTKNTGPIKYPGFFNDQGKFIDMSLRSRTKAARVDDLDSRLSMHLRKRFRFSLSDPESIYARHRGLHTDLTRDGELVLAKMVQSRKGAGTLQGEQRFVRHDFIKEEKRIRTLFMSGGTNFFVEVLVKVRGTYVLQSSNYISRERAVAAHRKDDILWEETDFYPTQADPDLSSDQDKD